MELLGIGGPAMEWPALVTLVALLEYSFFTMKTGLSRAKYGVDAPATSGNEEWERYFRVQQNTLEQLMLFLPALWVCAYTTRPDGAAGSGVLFLIGRPIYYASYVKDPGSRALGFLLGFVANVALLIGGVGGVLYNLFS